MNQKSQIIRVEELFKLSLVMSVEFLRQVGDHVGHHPWPEPGALQGPHLVLLLLGPWQVDLDVGDLRGKVEHGAGGGPHGGGQNGSGECSRENGDNGDDGSYGQSTSENILPVI